MMKRDGRWGKKEHIKEDEEKWKKRTCKEGDRIRRKKIKEEEIR